MVAFFAATVTQRVAFFAVKAAGHFALHIIPVVSSQRYWSLCILIVGCCCLQPKQLGTVNNKVLL
jgi:hypothetical protein